MPDFTIINNYKEWNNALWKYFFPYGVENPILYIDKNTLQNVGEKANIHISTTYEEDFLSKVLLSPERLRNFVDNWSAWSGRQSPALRNLQWDRFVTQFLIRQKMIDGVTPAYFAILCAIMYLACSNNANHTEIKTKAKQYLGENYRGSVAEIADDLFQRLHIDIASFDADREASLLRNIGKIKYHSILNPSDRADFIDFIEINHLKWESEPYADFINYRLIPVLSRADKRKLIDIVTQPEFIPYVKHILNSPLNFDRDESKHGNRIQTQDIVWRYELAFDIDGESNFSITTYSYMPFAIELRNNRFEKNTSSFEFEYLADSTELRKYDDQEFIYKTQNYLLRNIISDNNTWPSILYFEYVGDKTYHQVEEMQEKKSYLLFTTGNQRLPRNIETQYQPTQKRITAPGYSIYEITRYNARRREQYRANNKRIQDKLSLQNLGSWFTACLTEQQEIYWRPNLLNPEGELKKVDCIIHKNGKTYFRLPRTTSQQLSVKLFIKDINNDHFDIKENVTFDFEWDGSSRIYYLNEWGETTTEIPMEQDIKVNLLKRILDDVNSEPSSYSEMLLQILYDIADSNGCVSQKKLVASLKFVFDFFKIDDNKETRKSVIYALKRLGYIISYYDNENGQYQNQLVPCFLERTNYSINTYNNVYLVKGVYSQDKKNSLVQSTTQDFIKYKRPYDKESLHYKDGYRCLPDQILLYTNDTDGWKVMQYPIAEEIIRNMSDMSGFANHIDLQNRGDIWMPVGQLDTPCMIMDKSELLCTKEYNSFKIHRNFIDQRGVVVPIHKQLARTYCQNSKNHPVCIIGRDLHNEPETSKITFLSGMGKPYMLDMALCDLSLGLPASEYAFVVNEGNVQLHQKQKTCVESMTYRTGSYRGHDSLLLMALQKLGARTITDYKSSTAIFLCKNQRLISYGSKTLSMERRTNKNFLSMYILKSGEEIIAFSEATESHKVYYKDPHDNRFIEVRGDSLNQKLSDVITGNVQPNFNSTHSGPSLEDFTQSHIVRIIL